MSADLNIYEEIDCPQCGLPADKTTYTIAEEITVHCPYCGYGEIRGNTGKKATKGFGTVHYMKDGERKIVPLGRQLNIGDRTLILKELEAGFDLEESAFYEWNDDQKKVIPIVGTVPNTLDARYQEYAMEQAYYDSLRYTSGNNDDDFIPF